NYIISNSIKNNVIDQYMSLLGTKKTTGLYARRPYSLEIKDVIEKLPNNYAVTDKADGERYFLIIHNNHVYLISDLLNVIDSGIIINNNKKEYNNTILDGEYIF